MNSKSWRWFLEYALAILFVLCITVLLIGHVVLSVPITELFWLVAAVYVLFIIFGPLLYWSKGQKTDGQPNRFRLVASSSVLGGVCFLLFAYFGVRLKLIDPDWPAYLFSAIFIMAIGFGYANFRFRVRSEK